MESGSDFAKKLHSGIEIMQGASTVAVRISPNDISTK